MSKEYVSLIDKVYFSDFGVGGGGAGVIQGGGGSLNFEQEEASTGADVFSVSVDDAGSCGLRPLRSRVRAFVIRRGVDDEIIIGLNI